jgi:hypothetical protein
VDVLTIPADNDFAFDPLVVHREKFYPSDISLHHRGYPVQLNRVEARMEKVTPLVQADLWLEEPDCDAVYRIAAGGSVNIQEYPGATGFFRGNRPSAFNSQNTFISRKVLPYYFLFPGIGRMDDIWASYITQAVFPNSLVYAPASVVQERNPHDLSKDLEAEMIGYRHTLDLVKWLQGHNPLSEKLPGFFPDTSVEAWSIWMEAINA